MAQQAPAQEAGLPGILSSMAQLSGLPSLPDAITDMEAAVNTLGNASTAGLNGVEQKGLLAAFKLIQVLLQQVHNPVQPGALLERAAAAGQVKACEDAVLEVKARLEKRDLKVKEQLKDLKSAQQKLNAEWKEVVSRTAQRAAQQAARAEEGVPSVCVRVVRAGILSTYTDLQGQTEVQALLLEHFKVPEGAVLKARLEYPGGDRKRPPQAIIAFLTPAAFACVMDKDKRQVLASLASKGTRVCRHLSGAEHACRKALYAKYKREFADLAAAKAAGSRRSYRFSNKFTEVSIEGNEGGKLCLTEEEVSKAITRTAKAPTQAR
jgi:hypothetical protein